MDVSIIIVNYNTCTITLQCINSIIEKTKGCDYEIILVDNASTDGSIDTFTKDKRITFIEAGDNLGFGKANNLGVQCAKGKYLFFLNSDTYFCNDALTAFFQFAEAHQDLNIGGIGCLLQTPDGSITHSYSKFNSLWGVFSSFYIYPFYKLFHLKYKRTDTTLDDTTKPYFKVDFVTGADLFVKKEITDQYGLFDPDFFMYSEDSELQHRWTVGGYASYIIKTPQIVHLEGCSSKLKEKPKFNERKFYWGLKSKILYFKKCHTPLQYYIFRVLWLSNLLPILRGKYNFRQIKNMLRILIS